jgi:hypothetical protein
MLRRVGGWQRYINFERVEVHDYLSDRSDTTREFRVSNWDLLVRFLPALPVNADGSTQDRYRRPIL